jgi:hypothetical protein
VTFVSSYKYINELCDEKKFRKVPTGVFQQLRDAANDGLITVRIVDTEIKFDFLTAQGIFARGKLGYRSPRAHACIRTGCCSWHVRRYARHRHPASHEMGPTGQVRIFCAG